MYLAERYLGGVQGRQVAQPSESTPGSSDRRSKEEASPGNKSMEYLLIVNQEGRAQTRASNKDTTMMGFANNPYGGKSSGELR